MLSHESSNRYRAQSVFNARHTLTIQCNRNTEFHTRLFLFLPMIQVKALLFDVFGTVVDWRSSLESALQNAGAKHGVDADWSKFATVWREEYSKET